MKLFERNVRYSFIWKLAFWKSDLLLKLKLKNMVLKIPQSEISNLSSTFNQFNKNMTDNINNLTFRHKGRPLGNIRWYGSGDVGPVRRRPIHPLSLCSFISSHCGSRAPEIRSPWLERAIRVQLFWLACIFYLSQQSPQRLRPPSWHQLANSEVRWEHYLKYFIIHFVRFTNI